MSSNFQFLQAEWPDLFTKLKKAEERIYTEPISSANYGRLALEESIYMLYDFEYLEIPFNKDLISLLNHEEVKEIIPFLHKNGLHIVRKTGNNAAHYGSRVSSNDALTGIKYLYGFLKWFAQNYAKAEPVLPASFDEKLIPKIGEKQRKSRELDQEREKEQLNLQAQLDQLLKEREAILAKAMKSEQALAEYMQQQEAAKEAVQFQKLDRHPTISSEFTESETRKHLIDIDLKEAGWQALRKGREIEYPITGMPINSDNPKGNGFVDYVLWDDNGLPLALIEAKRSSKNIEVGKHQAFLYANCLEAMHGQRPVIFYTTGYETKLWNDAFYSTARRVYGFYTKDELQWLIQQRSTRKDARKAVVNYKIVERPYQIEAIQRVTEAFIVDSDIGFRGARRNALLVMATGSGKTRTAAAMVDILFKYNWVKRVLFLADRNALVRQAQRSFAEFLPNLSSIDLTEEKENDTTRLVFSTYPSMMNRIDNLRFADERFYGVGHFDLIIVDEAHRSVYNRYQSIFNYFDALIVGLTATPKNNIDHNTFELFGCSNDDPTFSFELEQAVPTYLCPFTHVDVATKFLREGIKYSDLSDKEKEKYEESFRDNSTGLFPEEIAANAMNKWLFNIDTVNKVLDTLMKEGIKIEGGDRLGRTIIFAVNQNHANFIVECFTKRYPELPSGFIATIHNQVSHAQSLIDAFCDHHHENIPQIVVSVDMMDTGIDAPRVLNLVFFKVVRSYAKFWQMIGRGTRLCPDVFGPNQAKEQFLIFDVCQNFEFFEINSNGRDIPLSKPITQQIFESRVHISRLLTETGEEENVELANLFLDRLHLSIVNLDKKRFQVSMSLRYVDEFSERSRWNNLGSEDVHFIEEHLSALPVPETINEVARRFDLMILKYQIAILMMQNSRGGYENNLVGIAEALGRKYTIPQVLRSKVLIERMQNPDFYKELTQKKIESIRLEIRELVQYLEAQGTEPIYTDLEDSDLSISAGEAKTSILLPGMYKKRVESFIRENKHHLTIAKLSSNHPITATELEVLEDILFDGSERGSKDDFVKVYGAQPLGQFIRSILGLEVAAAQESFSEFLRAGNLRADQMTFINNIISYLSKNGTIDKRMLFESPFTDINDQGLLGVFDDAEATKIISILDHINANAMVG